MLVRLPHLSYEGAGLGPVVHRDGAGLEAEHSADLEVVLQVPTHAGEAHHGRHAVRGQDAGRPDAAHLWRGGEGAVGG